MQADNWKAATQLQKRKKFEQKFAEK